MLTGDTSELLVNGAAFKLIIFTIFLAAVILMLVWFCNKQKQRNKTSARNLQSVIQVEAIASQQVSESESLDLVQQVSERESLNLDPQVSERESLNLVPQVSERESLDLVPQVSERESIDLDPQRMINTIVQGRSIEPRGSLEDQPKQSPVSSSIQPSLADSGLMPNDLNEVFTEVYATRPKWNNIGLAFNLPPATLESIRIKHREDPNNCLREMLYTRLKLEHPLTWQDVVNGLRCSTVGETALANNLATKYGLEQNNSPELQGTRVYFASS